MLFVERSNRTERLLAGLAERLMAPSGDPLAPNLVIVQGPGMERWIAQSIAREYGVLANTQFPFPREFLNTVFGAIPNPTYSSPNSNWEIGNLTWRIARVLEVSRHEADFAPLARHLLATDGDWRLVQLAGRISHLMDQYVTFRPEWVSKWVRSANLPAEPNERWQARIFRDVYSEIGAGHMADRAEAFVSAVESDLRSTVEEKLRERMPGRIEIFAVSTLPPLYLHVIESLARIRDVHLSMLSPSRHYWADLWQEVRDEPATASGSEQPGLFDAQVPKPAGTLLAGLGRLGGEFQRNLEEISDAQEGAVDLYESSCASDSSPSLLERVQLRILDLGEDADGEVDGGLDSVVSGEDDSIQIHVCHGARRELEIVEASLRAAFEKDDTLKPEDVLVMAPKIDEVAPDIVAVFGASGEGVGAIPYRIADRGAFRTSPVAEGFWNLLEMLGGRATRTEVLDWLTREPVAAIFGLDSTEGESLSDWAERAGIRFALDEDHRVRLGLPSERAHTWSGGLDRLALAHAVGASGDVFGGSSPVLLDRFGGPEILGALGDVNSVLRRAFRVVTEARDVPAWCVWLDSLLERTLQRTDENSYEHARVRQILKALSEASKEAGFDQPIPFEAIREQVGEAIQASPAPQPFLSGGVTFCELVPLRAIPFRIIVILGMSDGAFPRGGPAVGFDLMARHPRAGDRTTRNDDRYLFLEALLSAREKLILTVPGRDVRDGRPLPHSVVISDLLDMIDGHFKLEESLPPVVADSDRETLRDKLVVSHPLQSSSPRYFEVAGDARLIGRDEDAFLGAKARRLAIASGGGAPRKFLTPEILKVEEGRRGTDDESNLHLEVLIRRLLRSTRTFVREELRLKLPRPESSVDDLDPIELDGLTRYSLGNAMLEWLGAGATPAQAAERLMADAVVPAGVVGGFARRSMQHEVEEIAKIGLGRLGGERLADVAFEILIDRDSMAAEGPLRLVGRLDRLWPGGRVQLGFTRIGGRAELDLWIRHLVLCVLVEEGEGLVPRSVFVGRAESKSSEDRVVIFEKVDQARAHLGRLLEWADRATVAPLPFFTRTSQAFATKSLAGKADQGWRDARLRFEGSDYREQIPPESQEELESVRLWEGWSPLDSNSKLPVQLHFEELAEAFFEPLLDAREVRPK